MSDTSPQSFTVVQPLVAKQVKDGALWLSTLAAGALASHNIIPASYVPADAQTMAGAVTGLITGSLTLYAAWQRHEALKTAIAAPASTPVVTLAKG